MKTLHIFTIDKEIEVEQTQTQTTDGQTTTTTKRVKETKPIEFLVKRPSRADKEEAEIVRVSYLSEYVRRGIMPEAILSKVYANNGGTMDEAAKKRYDQMVLDIALKGEEYKLYKSSATVDDDAKAEAILKEIVSLRREIIAEQYLQQGYMENTAEFKAKTKLIEYLCVFLTYWRPDGKDPVPYFPGATFEEKLAALGKLEDDDDQVFTKVRERLLFVASLYVQLGGNIKTEEIDTLIKENL